MRHLVKPVLGSDRPDTHGLEQNVIARVAHDRPPPLSSMVMSYRRQAGAAVPSTISSHMIEAGNSYSFPLPRFDKSKTRRAGIDVQRRLSRRLPRRHASNPPDAGPR